jgi:hypothetical protein
MKKKLFKNELRGAIKIALAMLAFSSNSKIIMYSNVAGGYIRASKGEITVNGYSYNSLDSKKNNVGALAWITALFQRKPLSFGPFFGILFNNAKPRSNFGIQTNSAPRNAIAKNKSRGVSFIFGPEISLIKSNIHFTTGFALTFTGYKATFTSTSNAADKINAKSSLFKSLGGMPFFKSGYCLGGADIFGIIGYQFSNNAKFKKVSNGSTTAGTVADDISQAVKGENLKAKNGTFFLGGGVSLALND